MCQRVITTRLTGQLFVVQQLYIHSFKAFALQKVTDNEQTFKGLFASVHVSSLQQKNVCQSRLLNVECRTLIGC